MTSILLTRSSLENEKLKHELEIYNFNCVNFPLIEYQNHDFNSDILKNYSNIIITSKNAAKILANYYQNYGNNPPVFWVVGELSAAILKQAELVIKYIALNVEDLILKLPKDIYSESIYLSASEITQPLPSQIKRHIIYNVKYKTEIKADEIEVINKGIEYVLLYSQNCAKALIKLLLKQNLIKKLENATIVGISSKVVKEVLPYLKKILYCKDGEHVKMIELLITHAKNRK